jgi:inner membrane protein
LYKQNINYKQYFTTPAPLQNWLWYVVAGNEKGYYIGFRSLLDPQNKLDLIYFEKNDSLLKAVDDHLDVNQLKRFSKEFYTVEKWNDTLVFNDLRFGQILGWENKRGRFVFHYFLLHPEDNKLVVQRGRFKGWNWQTITNLISRIRGT